jgi:biopolymer transport protein ExbD
VAAKRPSKRRHQRIEAQVELRLIPVMSLLVVLVPMLLQTAVFERTAAIEMNLPSADEVRYLEEPDPEEMKDVLTLALTDEGFQLISGEETLARLPLRGEGGFDFEALPRSLEKAKERYPDQEDLVLLVEDQVLYDDIIHTMDICRPHFPRVSLADRVEAPAEE